MYVNIIKNTVFNHFEQFFPDLGYSWVSPRPKKISSKFWNYFLYQFGNGPYSKKNKKLQTC